MGYSNGLELSLRRLRLGCSNKDHPTDKVTPWISALPGFSLTILISVDLFE